MPEPRSQSIGEVITLLKEEFPEISVSKVRFLENQGLITPTRSASGYRQFFDEDVDRLRFILEQQRDHFLPLKVIKSRLADWEHGVRAWEDQSAPSADFFTDDEHASEEDLIRRSDISKAELASLEDHGVLRRNSDGTFNANVLTVARQARLLLDLGLEPRHLRTLKLTADRQADLVRQLVEPMLRSGSPQAHQDASDRMAIMAKSFSSVTLHLLRDELSSILES